MCPHLYDNVHVRRPTSIFASYDPETDTWSCAYRQLPSTMYAVQAQLVVRPAAEGGGSRTTLVAVGGQHTVGEDGIALQTVRDGPDGVSDTLMLTYKPDL